MYTNGSMIPLLVAASYLHHSYINRNHMVTIPVVAFTTLVVVVVETSSNEASLIWTFDLLAKLSTAVFFITLIVIVVRTRAREAAAAAGEGVVDGRLDRFMIVLQEFLGEEILGPNPANQPVGPALPAGPPAAAPREAIDALPTVIIANTESVCCVCLETFALGNEARQMPCNHVYHCVCIGRWLSQRNSCPICRAQLPVIFH